MESTILSITDEEIKQHFENVAEDFDITQEELNSIASSVMADIEESVGEYFYNVISDAILNATTKILGSKIKYVEEEN
jgi:hypothetical protein